MSEGCESCSISNRGLTEQLQITRSKAKAYAVEQKKTVAIYREGYEFRFCDADIAIQGNYLTVEFISQHQSATA